MSGKIKVECVMENKYGFVIGKIYDAYLVKSPMKNKNSIISVVDDYGDEYVYPSELFKIIEESK